MLSRRWIINYVLIVLIIVFTWIGNRYEVRTGVQPKPGITGLTPADVVTLAIQTADVNLSLRRVDDRWDIDQPLHWPANQINVARLLDIVDASSESRLAADEIDLAPLGLQFPRAVLQLNDLSILFGSTNNIGERRYVLLDSTVYLLPDRHLPFMTQGLTGLIDRRLLPPSLSLQALELPDLELIRDPENGWRKTEGSAHDEAQVTSLVENWQGLEASKVQRYDAAAVPRQKILAHLADGRELEFFLMSIEPEIVIAHPRLGLQYHFSYSLYYGLLSLREDEDPA